MRYVDHDQIYKLSVRLTKEKLAESKNLDNIAFRLPNGSPRRKPPQPNVSDSILSAAMEVPHF